MGARSSVSNAYAPVVTSEPTAQMALQTQVPKYSPGVVVNIFSLVMLIISFLMSELENLEYFSTPLSYIMYVDIVLTCIVFFFTWQVGRQLSDEGPQIVGFPALRVYTYPHLFGAWIAQLFMSFAFVYRTSKIVFINTQYSGYIDDFSHLDITGASADEVLVHARFGDMHTFTTVMMFASLTLVIYNVLSDTRPKLSTAMKLVLQAKANPAGTKEADLMVSLRQLSQQPRLE